MKNIFKMTALMLSLLIITSCTGRYEDASDKAMAYKSKVEALTAAGFNQMLVGNEAYTLIDVRQPAAYSADYIPGAVSLPRGDLEFKIADEDFWKSKQREMPGKEAPIVVYSAGGDNGVLAAVTLYQLGYENVRYLDGGLQAFKADKSAYASSETYKVLADHLLESGLDLPALIDKGVVTAAVVAEDPEAFYIIDIRSAEDFAKGHISGAVNSPEKDVLEAAKNASGKKILMVCYSGQKAAYASVLLRLSGYSSQIMKWGMSSWGPVFDKWSPNTSNRAIGHENWSESNTTTDAPVFNYPAISATSESGEGVLAERVQFALDKGLQTVTTEEVLNQPGDYYLANYWGEKLVEQYGHIQGAYRLNETLQHADPVGFRNLDPERVVVPHCWTGQTSAMVSAYLTVLGYEVKSLFFGANAMIEQNLEMNRWHKEKPAADFPFVN